MGVPFLYKWIRDHFKGQRSVVVGTLPAVIYSLSFDLNGLIHKAAQLTYGYGAGADPRKFNEQDRKNRKKLLKALSQEDRENEFIKTFEFLLRDAIGQINPTELLVITVDGLAPAAKIQQQRQRRYKSSLIPQSDFFDSNAITPGTEFMRKLNDTIQRFILAYRSNLPPKIRYSPSTGIGEGEHKIMDILRGLSEYVQPEPTTIKGKTKRSIISASASASESEDSKMDLAELQLIDRVSKNPITINTESDLAQVPVVIDWTNPVQRLAYRSFRESKEVRKTVHLKERKIYLTLLDFLTNICGAYQVRPQDLTATVVYVSQPALESHIPVIMKKFPKVVWHLYTYATDQKYSLKADNKQLFVHSSFSDEIAKQWVGKVSMFISDPALKDNLLKVQEGWLKNINPNNTFYSLLKFVLPFDNGITPYFDGILHIQAYTSQASTESRLITNGSSFREYSNKAYEEWFYYYNTIVRQHQKYITAINPGAQFKPEIEKGMYKVSADNILEVRFHASYNQVSGIQVSAEKISDEMKMITNDLKTFQPKLKIRTVKTVTTTAVKSEIPDESKTVPRSAYHAIYGLDADLIMLSLISPIKNILLVREDVRDILDIEQLRVNLREMMKPAKGATGTELDDFVLMMFMVGNDFLPHAPALPNIERAIDTLVETYKEVGLPLTRPKNAAIEWTNFIQFLGKLKDKEPSLLDDISKIPVTNPSKTFEQSVKRSATPLPVQGKVLTAFGGMEYKIIGIDYDNFRANWYAHCFNARGTFEAKEQMKKVLNYSLETKTSSEPIVPAFLSGLTPVVSARDSKSDTTAEDLFKPFYLIANSGQTIERMCVDYMKAMQFVYLYYRRGTSAVDMQFYYPYHYAPMLIDLYNCGRLYFGITPDIVSSNIGELKYDTLDQLLAVLPNKSQNLLPPPARLFYNTARTPIIDLFPIEFLIDRDGTNKDYQGIAIIPFADMQRISQATSYLQYPDRGTLFGVNTDMDYQLTDQQRAVIATRRQLSEDKKAFAELRSQYGFTQRGRGSERGRGRGRGSERGRGRGRSVSRQSEVGESFTSGSRSGSGAGAGAAAVLSVAPAPDEFDYDAALMAEIAKTKK